MGRFLCCLREPACFPLAKPHFWGKNETPFPWRHTKPPLLNLTRGGGFAELFLWQLELDYAPVTVEEFLVAVSITLPELLYTLTVALA